MSEFNQNQYINKYIKEVFSSNSFEKTFEIYFSKKLYFYIHFSSF